MATDEFSISDLILGELDERHAALLRSFTETIESHFQQSAVDLPDRMYHYTTLSVAQSIVANREFWLFSIYDPATEGDRGAGSIDQQEVSAGIDIICDEVRSTFSKRDLKAFSIFAEKFGATLKKHYREIATVHMLCVAAAPNMNLWKEAKERGVPASIVVPRELVEEWCESKERRTESESSGQYYPFVVCYKAEHLRQRVRPFCIGARDVLDRAVEEANGDREFLWSMMREISKQLSLPLVAEAYGYKSAKFAAEDEIRLLKIFPYGHEARGQSKHGERLRIVEKIEPHLSIELLTEHEGG